MSLVVILLRTSVTCALTSNSSSNRLFTKFSYVHQFIPSRFFCWKKQQFWSHFKEKCCFGSFFTQQSFQKLWHLAQFFLCTLRAREKQEFFCEWKKNFFYLHKKNSLIIKNHERTSLINLINFEFTEKLFRCSIKKFDESESFKEKNCINV